MVQSWSCLYIEPVLYLWLSIHCLCSFTVRSGLFILVYIKHGYIWFVATAHERTKLLIWLCQSNAAKECWKEDAVG